MTNSEIKDVLVRALARLKDGLAWTQGAMARDDAGVMVGLTDMRAVCWCTLGAIYAEVDDDERLFQEASRPLRKIVRVPAHFNDNARNFEEVREVYERAIKLLDA